MSVFTKDEREYLSGFRLGRLATVGLDGTPHVVPTGFRYNSDNDTIDIGAALTLSEIERGLAGRVPLLAEVFPQFASRLIRNGATLGRNPKVAFVVDDLASVNPWRVRGIEIRGEAEVLDTGGTELGPGFDPEMFRITPKRIVSWGLEEKMSYKARSVP